MLSLGIVDSGPLIASVNRAEPQFARSVAALSAPGIRLVLPAMVAAEATYMVERANGPRAEAMFLRGLRVLEVIAPEPDDWERIAELVDRYADFPLGGTDASIVALAERLNTDLIITLDRRHFAAIRPRHCAAFRILPE